MADGGDTPATRQTTLTEDWSRASRQNGSVTIHGTVGETVRHAGASVDADAERLRSVTGTDIAAR